MRAGIVSAAATLPDLVLAVPAGALVDRWNQKRVMIVADGVCAAAFGSLGLAVALDALTFGHMVAVAFVEGVGFVLFEFAEGTALPKVVADVTSTRLSPATAPVRIPPLSRGNLSAAPCSASAEPYHSCSTQCRTYVRGDGVAD